MTQDPPVSDTLSDSQLNALRNLAERQPGQDSNFVNISAAQALTQLGLARRGGGGWEMCFSSSSISPVAVKGTAPVTIS